MKSKGKVDKTSNLNILKLNLEQIYTRPFHKVFFLFLEFLTFYSLQIQPSLPSILHLILISKPKKHVLTLIAVGISIILLQSIMLKQLDLFQRVKVYCSFHQDYKIVFIQCNSISKHLRELR